MVQSHLAHKLWRVSDIQGHRNPFSEDLLRLTEAQLDFILEMFAKDHPDEYKFVKPGEVEPLARPEILAAWESRLIGGGREGFLVKIMPSEAVLKSAERLSGSAVALRREIERQAADGTKQGK